jgi:uncharacterized protein YjbI with pentapeptide repeats
MFAQANLERARLVRLSAREALFAEANAREVDFSNADLQMTVFLRASCPEANFKGADLTYAELSHADLTNADLSSATLSRARLHRIKDDGASFGPSRLLAFNTDSDIAQAEDWQPPKRPPATPQRGAGS